MFNDQPQYSVGLWIDTLVPSEGQRVIVQAQDSRGLYVLPFPVEFRGDDWRNIATGEALDCFVIGWQPLTLPS
jgi:hypothetical protein